MWEMGSRSKVIQKPNQYNIWKQTELFQSNVVVKKLNT